MAISPISPGDTTARDKINAAIVEANRVADKADASALAAESAARSAAIAAEALARSTADAQEEASRAAAVASLQAQINDRATQADLTAETDARQRAVSEEALAREDGDAAEAATRAQAVEALEQLIEVRASYAEVATPVGRIGEPGRFATADKAGASGAVTPMAGNRAVSDTNGAVISISAGVVAPIGVSRIEPGRQYRLRFVVQRTQDTLNPANDAIRLGIAWLKADKSLHSETVIADLVDIVVASGRLEYVYTVSRIDGDNVDLACPAAAVYARPFVRCYGNGLNHVEVIEWTDLSNSVDWSPDVSEFRRELAGYTFAIDTLNERADQAAADIEASHDARWITSGTLDDARLSTNVMLLDVEQTVTADKIFDAPLRMRDYLLIGDGEATGGGASARIAGSGNTFEIAPTNQAGDYRIDKSLGYDQANSMWRAKGGFRAEGALVTTGAATVGTNLTVMADATIGDDLTVTDDLAVGGDLNVAGAATIVGGTINGTTVGITAPAAAKFTSVDFTDKATTRTNLDVYDKAYVDNLLAAADAMVFKGVINASTNPNYPAANAGWTYRISVAGKIGGASGVNVEIGDLLVCLVESTASGTQAAVGTSWSIAQANLDGAVIGPASAVDATPAVFDGVTGKLLKNITFAAFKTALNLVKGDVGLGNVDNTSDADKPVSTAQATALNLKLDKTGGTITGNLSTTGRFSIGVGSDTGYGTHLYSVGSGFFETILVGANLDFYTGPNEARVQRLRLQSDGHIVPGADAAQRLGSSSLAFAGVHSTEVDLVDGITAPSAVVGRARMFVDAADGDLKIIFGDGTIKTIVTD